MDSLNTSIADASVLTVLITAVVALVVAFGLRGWVADLFARIRWAIRGGPGAGALVDVDGYVGEVERIGLTRIVLKSAEGARIWLPLSTVEAVAEHAKGHQACVVDIILPPGNDQAKFIEGMVVTRTESIRERFPNTLRDSPRLMGRHETNAGQIFLRVYFPIWPGCGEPIENVFRPQIADALRRIDPEYADWMIIVTYDAIEPA